MFNRDSIFFHGNHIKESYGPLCEVQGEFICPDVCRKCANCYGLKTRYWNEYDSNGDIWKYGAYSGCVWCGKDDSDFSKKIKKHIFKLYHPKEEVLDLSL